MLPFKGTRAHISCCCQSDLGAVLRGCTETSGGKAPRGHLARKPLLSTSGLVGEKQGLKDAIPHAQHAYTLSDVTGHTSWGAGEDC